MCFRLISGLCLLLLNLCLTSVAFADHSLYRLVWKDDPTSKITIGWKNDGGNNHRVILGENEDENSWISYPASISHRLGSMTSTFVDINGLKADTTYYFKICDDASCSDRKYFITAPSTAKPFTFVAGGDSRSNTQARRNANRLVAKIRPLFIAFGGDYMSDSSQDDEMEQWLEDWQLTHSDDGRMYPIIPTMGNHENNDFGMMQEVFNLDRNPDSDLYYYYTLSIGGGMMRLYTLNSEVKGNDRLWNKQLEQFESDLTQYFDQNVWNLVQYHHSIMPHTQSKPALYDIMLDDLLPLFTQYGMDLAIECDSHVVKSTFPAVSNGNRLSRDDINGTVFIGEGTWGTTPRTANRTVNDVTMASGSFNQIKLIHVGVDQMEIRTVRSANAGNVQSLTQAEQNQAPFALPAGLDLWSPDNIGPVLTLMADGGPTLEEDPGMPGDDTPRDEDDDSGLEDEEAVGNFSLFNVFLLIFLISLRARKIFAVTL